MALERTRRHVVGSLVLASTLVAALMCCSHQCGNDRDEDAAVVDHVERPTAPSDVSRAFAEHLPADTPWFVAVRNPAAIMGQYAAFRPHLAAVLGGDLGMVETDLRNTLGIDLARPESLDEAGVATNGGFAIAAHGESVVGTVVLSNRTRFEDRVTDTVRARPFNLRAEVERRRLGDANVLIYRGAEGAEPDLAVVTAGSLAFVLPDPNPESIDATVTELVGPRESSLATFDAFATSVDDAEGYGVHAFVSASDYVEAHREEVADAIAEEGVDEEERQGAVDRMAALGRGTAGLRLVDGNIEARLVQTPAPDAFADFVEITTGEGDPGFSPLAVSDVYAFVRLTVAAREIYRVARDLSGPTGRRELDETIGAIRDRVGMDPVAELLPALGSDVIVLLTRARLLTLSRAMNSGSPGEFFSGLGVVIAVEVRDAETVKRALDTIVPGLDGRATLFEDSGTTVIEFTDADADIGNIVLSDRFLLLVPSRQRQEVVEQLSGDASDLSWCDVDDARALVTAPSGNGLFIDVHRVVDGPIGQVAFARLPVEARRALGRIDRIHTTTTATDRAIVSDIGIRFAAPDDGAN